MATTYRIPASYRKRVIRGRKNWWFLGPGGLARLQDHHLDDEGGLTAAAEDYLRAQGLYAEVPPKVYALTVLTSTDCNLGCGYCFQNLAQDETGGSRPPRMPRARLSSATIEQTLDFASRQMAAVGLDKLHVLLFGGEPLLNPRGCKHLLERAADHGLESASMVSNATLLKPALAAELFELGLRSVQVTFDGAPAVHDAIRIRRSGGGTFDAIVENMAAVSDTVPLDWSIRVNVSHHNQATLDGLIDALAERLDPAMCGVYFAWVGDAGVGYTNQMRASGSLADRFFQWQRRATEAGFRVARPGASGPCSTCSFSDGKYGAVVNADGVLSSCWETAGRAEWRVGTVVDGYLPAEQTQDRWISCEDNRRYASDGEPMTEFNDAVDAAFLDYLDETGRLDR